MLSCVTSMKGFNSDLNDWSLKLPLYRLPKLHFLVLPEKIADCCAEASLSCNNMSYDPAKALHEKRLISEKFGIAASAAKANGKTGCSWRKTLLFLVSQRLLYIEKKLGCTLQLTESQDATFCQLDEIVRSKLVFPPSKSKTGIGLLVFDLAGDVPPASYRSLSAIH